MPAGPRQMPARLNPGAFTLVELLVVIAIVALLVAVLLPSLSAARSQARQLTCLANLRSTNTAMLGYSIDNKLAGAPHSYRSIDGNGPHFASGSANKTTGDSDNWSGIAPALRKNHGIFQGIRSYLNYETTPATSTIYYQSKGCPDYTRSVASNGANRYAFFANHWILGLVGTAETDDWFRLSSNAISNPAAMMLMMESSYQGSNSDTGFGSMVRRTMLGETTSNDVYTARHRSEGLNTAFIDGHAEFRKHQWGANAFVTPIIYSPRAAILPY
jgi:prepilin-type N-terminal cleavage/methylation domain-containing protein/prepilin-type processing-associated H-X9-DG protein